MHIVVLPSNRQLHQARGISTVRLLISSFKQIFVILLLLNAAVAFIELFLKNSPDLDAIWILPSVLAITLGVFCVRIFIELIIKQPKGQ